MDWIIFFIGYLLCALSIWYFVHRVYSEKNPYKEDNITKGEKIMWVIFNFLPIINVIVCIILILALLLAFGGETIILIKQKFKLKDTFDKFYKLK